MCTSILRRLTSLCNVVAITYSDVLTSFIDDSIMIIMGISFFKYAMQCVCCVLIEKVSALVTNKYDCLNEIFCTKLPGKTVGPLDNCMIGA